MEREGAREREKRERGGRKEREKDRGCTGGN